MAHNCKRVQSGHQVCADHMLTQSGLRYRFKKMMSEIIEMDQLIEWHELMSATMLPADRSVIPLDDRPHAYIERVANGGELTT